MKVLEALFIAGITVFIFLVLFLALAWPTMILWNWLMPSIFDLRELTFWETLGLMILSTMFFYRGSSSSSK